MSVVAIVTTKGGAGKSTIAVHLAVAAALKKRRPLLIDFDKQLSVLLWGKGLRKKAKTPVVWKGDLSTLIQDVKKARKKHDIIIVDVAAGGGDDARQIATIADHILLPVRPSAFDIAATSNTIELLRTLADNTEPEEIAYRNALGKTAIVLNGAPKRPTAKWRREVEEALDQSGAGNLPVIGMLADRDAYRASIEHGHGVSEEGDDAAIAEILKLYEGLHKLENERASKLKRRVLEDG